MKQVSEGLSRISIKINNNLYTIYYNREEDRE